MPRPAPVISTTLCAVKVGGWWLVGGGGRALRRGSQWLEVQTTNHQPPTTNHQRRKLPRHRVRADLELHQLALGALAAFDVPHEVRAVVRIQPATLPAPVGIVDAAVHPTVIEPERIR